MAEPPQPDAARHLHAAGRRCDIQLQNPCRYPEAGARRLRPWLSPLIAELAPAAGSFAVRFVSDREMRRLNARFRGLDKATDVLSFPGDLDGSTPAVAGPNEARMLGGVPHLGDVAIAVPTARRQATRRGHSTDIELRVLLLHGVLHCLGHDHETDGGVMDRLERRLRKQYIGRLASEEPHG